jgi:nitrogenase-associated protein
MARVTFYEKPGCGGNAKQKALLRAAGHELEVKSLLTEAWTRESLLAFLSPLPVPQWFNRSAPMVKDGRVDPDNIDAEHAIALLLQHPLLVRRPLMEAAGVRRVGFVLEEVDAWLGLAGQSASEAELGCQGNTLCSGHHHDEKENA